jgi:hypothetical protein
MNHQYFQWTPRISLSKFKNYLCIILEAFAAGDPLEMVGGNKGMKKREEI